MRPRWIFRVTLQDLIDDKVSWNKQAFDFRNLEIHSSDVMVRFCKAEIFIRVYTLACSSYLAIELIFCQRCKPAKHEWQTSVVLMIPRCQSSKGHKNSTEIVATLINTCKTWTAIKLWRHLSTNKYLNYADGRGKQQKLVNTSFHDFSDALVIDAACNKRRQFQVWLKHCFQHSKLAWFLVVDNG